MSGPITHLFIPDPRFGRHVFHDPASRDYDVRALLLTEAPPQVLTLWARHGEIFDQGACPPEVLAELGADPRRVSLGCCTMAAAFGLLNTDPFARACCTYTMADVLRGYAAVTRLDEAVVSGVWPPTDTGSTGLFAMRALRERRLIQAYRWAFRLSTALAYLAHGPFAAGTVWYDSMITPVQRDGRPMLEISPDAAVVGGHEWVVDGIDPGAELIRMTQSWGPEWGDHGRAWMTYATFDRLLHERGDVVVPVVRPNLAGRRRGALARPSSFPDTLGLPEPG